MKIVFQLSVHGFCPFICWDTELFFSISKHLLHVKEICLGSVICARNVSPHFNFACVCFFFVFCRFFFFLIQFSLFSLWHPGFTYYLESNCPFSWSPFLEVPSALRCHLYSHHHVKKVMWWACFLHFTGRMPGLDGSQCLFVGQQSGGWITAFDV